MRIKLLTTALCMTFLIASLSSYAQVNTYLQNNPIWQLSSMCSTQFPCVQDEDYNYYTNGDTILNSLVYKKIYRKGQGTYNWMAPPPSQSCSGSYSYNYSTPYYFIRSSGKQMYIRQPSDTNEYLLYDFNLSVGSTLPLSFNNFDNTVTVTAIDSIYTPYGYLQRFTLSGNTWSQYLMEGIGHSRGLVEPLQTPLECGFTLDCFSLNDTSYYPSTGPTCNLNVGQQEIFSGADFSVYPNPATNNLFVEFKDFSNPTKLSIYNTLGEKVSSQQTEAKSVKIDISMLKSGVYFLCVDNGNAIRRKKIIKSID